MAPPPSASDPPAPGPDYLAAVDLGSNSFHLVIARVAQGEPAVVDALREPVRLAEGLDDRGHLGAEARVRALACLERFGERLRHKAGLRVRAVGTNTLRAARDAGDFLDEAERALGHEIDVISGLEEARLIYLGVSHSLPDHPGRRLVVDIGGGSTEIVLGERFEPLEAHSLYMGCIEHTRRYLPGGRVRRKAFARAVLAARGEVQTIERHFRDVGWTEAVGSSGTIRAVADVLQANGWGDGTVTAAGLHALRDALVAVRDPVAAPLPGLKPDRAPVFAGGVAILTAIFESLDVDRMVPCGGALREGVLYDLLGRLRSEDVRERTVRLLQERYHVDLAQAARVERDALALLRAVAGAWGLEGPYPQRLLAWAARLHEVGLAVAYSGYHKHGAYLLAHGDLPGFSRLDQALLAALVRLHRRRASRRVLRDVPRPRAQATARLAALLRLAVVLGRARAPHPVPPLALTVADDALEVAAPAAWLEANPLTRLGLEAERAALARLGVRLRLPEPPA